MQDKLLKSSIYKGLFFSFKSLDEMYSAKTYTEVKHDHLCSLYRSYILVWLFSVSCTEKVNSVSHKSFLHLIVITDKKYLTWMSSCTDAKTHYVQTTLESFHLIGYM